MRNIRGALILIVFRSLTVSTVDAGEPRDLIQRVHDQMVQLLNDPTLQSKDKETELNDRLRAIVMPETDINEMAKRILVKHWNRLTTAEQEEFIEVFRMFYGLLDRIPPRFASTQLVPSVRRFKINLLKSRATTIFQRAGMLP